MGETHLHDSVDNIDWLVFIVCLKFSNLAEILKNKF